MAGKQQVLKHTHALIEATKKRLNDPKKSAALDDMLKRCIVRRSDTSDNKSNYIALKYIVWGNNAHKEGPFYKGHGMTLVYSRLSRSLMMFENHTGMMPEKRFLDASGKLDYNEFAGIGWHNYSYLAQTTEDLLYPEPGHHPAPDDRLHFMTLGSKLRFSSDPKFLEDDNFENMFGYKFRLEFERALNRDLNELTQDFLGKIDAEAAACCDDGEGRLRADLFTWAVQPTDAKIRARRRKALAETKELKYTLFRVTSVRRQDDSHPKYYKPVAEIEQRIDAGENIFKVLANYSGVDPDLLREQAKKKTGRLASVVGREALLFALGMKQYCPDLELPKVSVVEPEGSPFRVFSKVLFAIKEMTKGTRVRPGSQGHLAASILQSVAEAKGLSPRFLTWGSIGQLLDNHGNDVRSMVSAFVDTPKTMVRHLFLPLYLQQLQQNGVKTLTTEHVQNTPILFEQCIRLMEQKYDAFNLRQVQQVVDIDRQVQEFGKWAVQKDAVLKADPAFRVLGFALSDTDTQEKIFEMYRHKVFGKVWDQYRTLNEFVMNAGIYPLIRDAARTAAKAKPGKAPEPA